MSNFLNILPMGAELFRADRQTCRHDKADSSSFANLRKSLKNNKNKNTQNLG